jgi:hypothetical protein
MTCIIQINTEMETLTAILSTTSVAPTLLMERISSAWHMLVSDIDTYNYVQVVQFFKLLPVSMCTCQCPCRYFIVHHITSYKQNMQVWEN